MIRVLATNGKLCKRIATRKGLVETLAIISDMLDGSESDRAYIRLKKRLSGYTCNKGEHFLIVVKHSDMYARPDDRVEIRLHLAIERYTLQELRDCFQC